MPPDHVHLITAGENIHTAYPAIFRTLPGITRTYILAEEETYSISPDKAIEARRQTIRKAVDSVKELSATLSIPCSRELVFPPVYPSARDLLEKIVQDNPGARFTLDLSAGSRSLCTALASMAPWLEAEVYSSFDEKVPRAVPGRTGPSGASSRTRTTRPSSPSFSGNTRRRLCPGPGSGYPAITCTNRSGRCTGGPGPGR